MRRVSRSSEECVASIVPVRSRKKAGFRKLIQSRKYGAARDKIWDPASPRTARSKGRRTDRQSNNILQMPDQIPCLDTPRTAYQKLRRLPLDMSPQRPIIIAPRPAALQCPNNHVAQPPRALQARLHIPLSIVLLKFMLQPRFEFLKTWKDG